MFRVRINAACRRIAPLLLVLLPLAVAHPVIAADEAAVNAAIDRGTRWLRANIRNQRRDIPRHNLCAMALYKVGVPANDAEIQWSIARIEEWADSQAYQPRSHHLYTAGVNAMMLTEIDSKKYGPLIGKIVDYIIKWQTVDGAWNYQTKTPPGDTSVTQYALLGLWAGERAGFEVPDQVWNDALTWLLKSQRRDGGYVYRPPGGDTTLNMTSAALGSLVICQMHLFPGRRDDLFRAISRPRTVPSEEPAQEDLLQRPRIKGLSVLEPILADTEEPTPQRESSESVPFYAVQNSAQGAKRWMDAHFAPRTDHANFVYYYYYTLERMGALAGIKELGGRDWYDTCADYLLSVQQADGRWANPHEQDEVATAFALLFLTKATGKIVDPTPPPREAAGSGLLAGGRGLPANLADVQVERGRVSTKQTEAAIDDLLTLLSQQQNLELVQEKLVEQVQLGDRQDLIGQTDRLKQLAEHSDPEVRRTALWAIGRTDDLSLARYLIDGLTDPDVSVNVEARNGLCWISRRPNGFGLPAHPLESLPNGVADSKAAAAIEKWRNDLLAAWGPWYLEHRPAEERDDRFGIELQRKLKELGVR